MDTGEKSSGQFDDLPASDGVCETIKQGPDAEDNGVDSAVAEVDYWLGAGASQEIASMCVDAELSPDEDMSPSSVEGHLRASAVPSSVDENLFTQERRVSPHVEAIDTAMDPPLQNPFLTLNPYPQFIFPDSMLPNDTEMFFDDQPVHGRSSASANDTAKEAFLKAHGFDLPAIMPVDRAPSSALSPETVKEVAAHGTSSALAKDTAKEAFLKAHGFGPPPDTAKEVPVHGRSSASAKHTAKDDLLKALGFGPPGALPGRLEVEADLTRQKTSVSIAEADYNAPAEDKDSFLFPNSDDSPMADDVTKDMDESREPLPRQPAGRISSPTWDVLNAGFQKIDDTINDLAIKTGRTRENIISLWKCTHAHECTGSMWNKYQKYFLANREKERRRIGDSRANCKYFFYRDIFSADSDHLGRTCWLGFKEHEPRWREILDAYDEVLAASNVHSTISQRTRKFDSLVNQLKRVTNKAAEQDGFESLFVLVGNSIHEDVGLSQVHLSAGGEEVCPIS